MSTSLLERPDVIVEDKVDVPNDPDKFKHLFPKKSFDEFFLNGVPMVALCGFVKTTPPQSQGDQPICLDCQLIYDTHNWVDHGPEDGEPPL